MATHRSRGVRRAVVLMSAGLVVIALATPPVSGASPSPGPVSPTPLALEPRPLLPPLVDGEADPCIPLCTAGRLVPGLIPAGERYQTEWFFGGYMTIRPETSWTGIEDSTGEFKLAPTSDPSYGWGFSLDLFLVHRGARVMDVPNTSADLLAWLAASPDLIVSAPIPSSIDGLPASAVDVALSPSAVSDDPTCPASACVNFLRFERWDHANGIAGDDVYRLYLADVVYGGSPHVLTVTVEARDAADLAASLPAIEAVLATVQVPARAP